MTDCRGHLFIDVTGTSRLFGPPPDLAWRLRRAIRSDTGFNPIWSVASNKLVAKVATRMVKPTGEFIVVPGGEKSFLAPLPVGLIPGIEPTDLKRLREFNLSRVAHISALSVSQLEVIFDKRCQSVYEAVRGIDPSPVTAVGRQPPRICRQHLFGTDTNDVRRIESALYTLIEQSGAALRRKRLATRRIRLTLDYSDGKRGSRFVTVRPATNDDFRLFAVAAAALGRIWHRRVRIRRLQLTCGRLTYPPAQQSLFAEEEKGHQTRTNLIAALDAIRHRFGSQAIRTGRTLAV
jgi:DNA polymerase-4